MSLSPQNLKVLNREQLACLSTPVKGEIFEAMLRIGPASVNALAAYLDRSPKALYYHVRQLCAVGLMQIKETRLVGKRTEAIYRLTADRFVLEEGEDAEYRQTAARSVSALLRQVDREFRAASEATDGVNITEVIRVVTRLRPEAVERLLEMLRDAARFARESADSDQGDRVALTMLLATPGPRAGN